MMKKRCIEGVLLLITVFVFYTCLSSNVFAAQINSTSYKQNVVVTTGGDNLTGSSFKTSIVTSIINGIINSTSYINRLGFFHTWLLANNQPCTTASQCEGNFCCSNLCKSSACPSESSDTGTGGGAAGSSGGGAFLRINITEEEKKEKDFSISPSSFSEDVVLGAAKAKAITIKNTGTADLDFDLSVATVDDFVFLSDNSFSLQPGQEKQIEINFIGKKLGSYVGEIEVSADGIKKFVTAIVNVESEQVLFDTKVDVTSPYKIVNIGDELRAQITLLNVGPPRKVDVITTYLIKDKRGNILYEASETFAVERQISYAKSFKITDKFKEGDYLLVIEVRYDKSFAVSSELFTVAGKKSIIGAVLKNTSPMTLMFGILIGMAIILTYLMGSGLRLFSKRKKK